MVTSALVAGRLSHYFLRLTTLIIMGQSIEEQRPGFTSGLKRIISLKDFKYSAAIVIGENGSMAALAPIKIKLLLMRLV